MMSLRLRREQQKMRGSGMRNNYYEIVAEVDGEGEQKKIRTGGGGEKVIWSGSEISNTQKKVDE